MSDRHDVERLYFGLLAAWNERDAAGWSARFCEDGSLVGFDGSQVDSRDAIAEHLGGIFGDHEPATYVGKVREVRDLGAGSVLLRAVAGMIPPGDGEIEPELNTVHALVAVEQGGEWRVALLQSTPARFDGRPDAVATLTAELREMAVASRSDVPS